mmetsp:Transcript_21236/g.70143  ORF Transcript_21236/g.70143 Transcript_21236/m.70143 type:complete len:308 (-) Transcript_21236:1977-2900(-)
MLRCPLSTSHPDIFSKYGAASTASTTPPSDSTISRTAPLFPAATTLVDATPPPASSCSSSTSTLLHPRRVRLSTGPSARRSKHSGRASRLTQSVRSSDSSFGSDAGSEVSAVHPFSESARNARQQRIARGSVRSFAQPSRVRRSRARHSPIDSGSAVRVAPKPPAAPRRLNFHCRRGTPSRIKSQSFAPAAVSNSTTRVCPASTQRTIAVLPPESTASTAEPAARSCCTTETSPEPAPAMRAVYPMVASTSTLANAFTSAPAASSAATERAWPASAALIRGVYPIRLWRVPTPTPSMPAWLGLRVTA